MVTPFQGSIPLRLAQRVALGFRILLFQSGPAKEGGRPLRGLRTIKNNATQRSKTRTGLYADTRIRGLRQLVRAKGRWNRAPRAQAFSDLCLSV